MPTVIQMFTQAKAAMLLNRLAIFRFFLFSFGSLAAAAQTALAGMNWSTSDNQTRLMVIIGILASWSIAMMAFLDKTMARIAQGENPFVDTPSTTETLTVQKQTTTNP